jgi:hypothetical protein
MDSVARSDLKDVAADVLDHGFQVLVDSEVLTDIPLVGVLLKVFEAGVHVRDAVFTRKLFQFLWHVGAAVSEEERQKFAKEMDEDPETRKRVGERLLLAIDRLDDLGKARLLANAFSARLRGEIKLREFDALVTVIDRIMLTYLDDYAQVYWLQNTFLEGFGDRTAQLQNCDLLSQSQTCGVQGTFQPTGLGDLFFKKVVPPDLEKLRADFAMSLPNMPVIDEIAEARYSSIRCNRADVETVLAELTDAEFLGLKLIGNQFNREHNEWMLRRIGPHQFQRFWETRG